MEDKIDEQAERVKKLKEYKARVEVIKELVEGHTEEINKLSDELHTILKEVREMRDAK